MRGSTRRRLRVFGAMALVTGCAGRSGATPSTDPASVAQAHAAEIDADDEADPIERLAQAEAALGAQQAARAIALFGRVLGTQHASSAEAGRAYLGLGRAHEQLGDCAAAIRAYDAWLERFDDRDALASVLARRGACEAEIGHWERSAESFRRVASDPDLLPSARVEALAREGLALFHLERFDDADRVLARADEVYERARAGDTERFGDYYFVGMARFYRAAILHRAFREVRLELPEPVMEAALQRKLDLLTQAQEAYNHTIAAKHMFWVSAAGYQLGHMFGEFYDAVVEAPVPTWLDERQRAIYFEELGKQVRPVLEKAVWVFDKNLETARRLGYESPFIDRTRAKLAHLQAVLISDAPALGGPGPAFAKEPEGEVAPPAASSAVAGDAASPAERKLFVPRPTPL